MGNILTEVCSKQPIILNNSNIVNLFDKVNTYPFKFVQKLDNYITYEIEEKIIDDENGRCQIFKIIKTKNELVECIYIAVYFYKRIGSGAYGIVYEGFDFTNNKKVVVKYGDIFSNEIVALDKTNLFIAHKSNFVIMYKAPGISYEDILKDKSISDQIKIDLHRLIVSELVKLNTNYGIEHGDPQPRHVFIENDIITFIDFGHSRVRNNISKIDLKYFCDRDINYFNRHVYYIISENNSCGESFNKYISQFYNGLEIGKYIMYGVSFVIVILAIQGVIIVLSAIQDIANIIKDLNAFSMLTF